MGKLIVSGVLLKSAMFSPIVDGSAVVEDGEIAGILEGEVPGTSDESST